MSRLVQPSLLFSPGPAPFLEGRDAATWARSHLTFQLSQRPQPHPRAQLWPRVPYLSSSSPGAWSHAALAQE